MSTANYLNSIVDGDCSEILKNFDADSVDMVLTSPPYDALRNYKGYQFPLDRKITRLNSSHVSESRMPSSA